MLVHARNRTSSRYARYVSFLRLYAQARNVSNTRVLVIERACNMLVVRTRNSTSSRYARYVSFLRLYALIRAYTSKRVMFQIRARSCVLVIERARYVSNTRSHDHKVVHARNKASSCKLVICSLCFIFTLIRA